MTTDDDVFCRSPSTDNFFKFCPRHIKRPLLLCASQEKITMALAKEIDDGRDGHYVILYDHFGTCNHCSYKRTQSSGVQPTFRRKVRLHTICQGKPTVEVEDWTCPACKKLVYFTGASKGVFPVRRTEVYTCELLYIWVQHVCRLGYSFRAAFDSYRITSTSASALARYDVVFGKGPAFSNTDPSKIVTRRRASEAFRLFLDTLDVDDEQLCESLFSCDTCETKLTPTDIIQLGLSTPVSHTLKRFDAVVVDGTAPGILGQLPNYSRPSTLLPVHYKLRKHQKLIPHRPFQQALHTLLKCVRENLRSSLRTQQPLSPSHFLKFPLNQAPSSRMGSSRRECTTVSRDTMDHITFLL